MRGFGVSRRSEGAPCCALDEGRSLGAALQEEASNRHERLLPNGDGRERHGQKARLDCVRYQSASERKAKPQQAVVEETPAPAPKPVSILRSEPIAEFALGIEAAMVETLSSQDLMTSRLLRAKKTSAYSDTGLPPSQFVSRVT
jgi:hypothetical protein